MFRVLVFVYDGGAMSKQRSISCREETNDRLEALYLAYLKLTETKKKIPFAEWLDRFSKGEIPK